MKDDANPVNLVQLMNAAPRCTATSKRTGRPCKAPAVRGWSVCRMHGARGGHGPGAANPAYRHGMRSREWVETRKSVNDLVRAQRGIEELLG